ncbi:MAG TPA: hypothetical protein PLD55_12990, partial [bacterium]|nr:hypothetical protein [bacterium]
SYPYHQVLGFLLERSGAPEEQLSLFENIGVRYRFYLDREITEPVLSKRWNLIYPETLIDSPHLIQRIVKYMSPFDIRLAHHEAASWRR